MPTSKSEIDNIINYIITNFSDNGNVIISVQRLLNLLNKKKNNETIGQSAEFAVCKVVNIPCPINIERIDEIRASKIIKALEEYDITSKLPSKIRKSIGNKNGPVDFKLDNNETLSLKTLEYNTGKVVPQGGQPTYNSFDKQYNKQDIWQGSIDNNTHRWEFIKNMIYEFLNKMLTGLFCCDYTIIIKNCNNIPEIKLYSKKDIHNKLQFFTNQELFYTQEYYIEKWNNKKNKYSEFSSVVKVMIDNKLTHVGEFQFHKNSRKQVKLRFYNKFIETLF